MSILNETTSAVFNICRFSFFENFVLQCNIFKDSRGTKAIREIFYIANGEQQNEQVYFKVAGSPVPETVSIVLVVTHGVNRIY